MDYDLFVIGGGSGGIRAARTAASLGARVAVAEQGPLGGTCVNVGCVPKKMFVYAAHYAEHFRDAAGYGWQLNDASFDWPTLIHNKNAAIERLNELYRGMLDGSGVDLYENHARVTGAHEITLADGKTITAANILVATGGHPTRPNIPGAELGIVSDDAFFLESLPDKVMVVGGGYIGVEFAGIFHGLGVETIQIYRGDMFLRGFDDDSRRFLAEQMQQQGVDLRFHCEVERVDRDDSGRLQVQLSGGEPETVDTVLFATGRHPNTESLGLEELGVELTANGAILVDQQYNTAVPSIYAVGDVIERLMLTPVALAEGSVVARRLFGESASNPDYDLVATCVFSQPNMASVGMDEHTARDQGMDVLVYRNNFRPLQYSLTDNPTRSFVKLVVEKHDERVLGAFMVGPDAGEIMQGLSVAMTAGATKAQFDATLGIHPTSAEEFVTLRESVKE